MILHLDYETRSRVDLIKHGVYRYAKHPSTKILFMAWAFNEEEPALWRPGETFPNRVAAHWTIGARRGTHAHNAAFERLITEHILGVKPPLEHWYCTAAQARARALPGALDNLGRCLGIDIQKGQEGKNLIRKHSIPWAQGRIDWEHGTFDDTPASMELFGAYCLQDVAAERAAATCSPPLTEDEFDDYVLNETINDRGIEIDQAFAVGALQYADAELDDIKEQLVELTDGRITTPRQFARIKTWIEQWMDDAEVRHAVTVHKTDRRTGETTKKISLDRGVRHNILMSEYEWPRDFLTLVQLLDLAGSTSVSKYQAMLNRVDDGRLRGAYIYAGAGQTKRFSSTGAQLHNMRRDTPKNFRAVRASIIAGRPIEHVMHTLAACLRPTLRTKARSRRLVGCDLSQIEARVTPWLAVDEWRLDLYRAGVDVYVRTADDLYPGRGDELRQVGKVAELALGFGGGVKALQSMARNFDMLIDDDTASTIVARWRGNNSWCTRFWEDCQRAVMRAVRSPGTQYGAGRLSYVYQADWDALYCTLPSGGVITYPRPRVELGRFEKLCVTAVKANWLPAQGETEWPRVELYGGLLCENGTQAAAGEILRCGMRRVGGPICAHTHDEIVLDVPKKDAEMWEKRLQAAMTHVEPWMEGLPLNAETFIGTVYGK